MLSPSTSKGTFWERLDVRWGKLLQVRVYVVPEHEQRNLSERHDVRWGKLLQVRVYVVPEQHEQRNLSERHDVMWGKRNSYSRSLAAAAEHCECELVLRFGGGLWARRSFLARERAVATIIPRPGVSISDTKERK